MISLRTKCVLQKRIYCPGSTSSTKLTTDCVKASRVNIRLVGKSQIGSRVKSQVNHMQVKSSFKSMTSKSKVSLESSL